MPNFDTGHYFLTLLSPIKQGNIRTPAGEVISYAQNLRKLLAALPTAHQSPATNSTRFGVSYKSPLTLSQRTHLCRFAVIDDVIYNGRTQRNAILTKLQKVNLIKPQRVDRLNASYLMFTAELDASLNPNDPLPQTLTQEQQDEVRDTYARELWDTMPAEIHEIYKNCEGFDPSSAEDCVAYMRRCQVETTMPFNDYWLEPPALTALPMPILKKLIGALLGVTALGLVGWVLRWDWFPLGWLFGWSAGWTFFGGLLLSAAALAGAYIYIMRNGQKPLPAGKYADLPSVLKALYLQQRFADFAIAAQGNNDQELYDQFGMFIEDHQPDNKMSPSQEAGVIGSRAVSKPANGEEVA